jgi:hypothetical protein
MSSSSPRSQAAGSASSLSPIKSDEFVVFFPTFGYQLAEAQSWELLIHGWIHKPEVDSRVRRVTIESLRKALRLGKDDLASEIFRQRARAFLVDNKRGKRISIRLNDSEYPAGRSQPDGHFRGSVRLSHDEVGRLTREEQGRVGHLSFHAVSRPGDDRVFAGALQLIQPTGVSVISDVDDTIKVSDVHDKKALLANTFLREFRAIPGMADLYTRWANAGVAFHYVSASPWQLYVPISDFLRAAGFPSGSLHLRRFRWADTSSLDLFASPEKSKRRAIEPILAAFPHRRFILIGDSGELDPEIYASLARQRSDQITCILICDLSGEGSGGERFSRCFAGLPRTTWTVFQRPVEVEALVSAVRL